MKVLISLSATKLAKDQRVIIKHAKDEWYAGIITSVGRDDTYRVLYNDGSTDRIKASLLKPILVKGRRGDYTDEEANALIKAFKEKNTKPRVTTRMVDDSSIIPPRPQQENINTVLTPDQIRILKEGFIVKYMQASDLPLKEGRLVVVKWKSVWVAGRVKALDGNEVTVALPSGEYVDSTVKNVVVVKKVKTPGLDGGPKPTGATVISRKLEKMGITDPALVKKLNSIPYLINVQKQVGLAKHAGFFPFPAEAKTVSLFDGTKLSKDEFFGLMKKVGGGLTGKPSSTFNPQKGRAKSRIDGTDLGSSDCKVDGLIVPEGWVAHYRSKYKIPLNLFSTRITSPSGEVVYARYIAKKPIF
jgi:hypothetical protein